jgi:hypothetical protein
MVPAKEEAMNITINGLAFVIMTLSSTLACTIAYWAGKQASR